MTRFRQYPYLLPFILGILGIFLLLRILIFDHYILIPEDTDVIILIVILSIGMILAIYFLVRLSLTYLRYLTMQRVRNNTLAEHRRFLQRLDHELKNPLTALRAGLKTLLITNLNDQQQSLVNTMETEVLRLSRLVSDLRKIADLETQPIALQPTNLEDLFKNILETENARFEGGQRKLESVLSFSRKIWLVDADLLTLAMYNLLDNAFKYTNPHDTVSVTVHGQNELLIEIQDSGIGISQDDLPHIWEELYRATSAKHVSGSGIGLALIKAIIERHEGTIHVESTLGLGTIIRIHIPLIPQS